MESNVAPSSGMSDKAGGMYNQGMGGMKEGVGRAIGNERMQAEGNVQKNAGRVENKEGDIKRSAGQ